MALPEKNYYSLWDVSERWGISLQDTRYYAEHGLLETQVWLPEIIVKIFRNKRMEDGETAPVQIGVSDFKGYAVVETDALREIFRHNTHAVTMFKTPCNTDFIKMFDPRTPFMLTIDDLVISKCERDRFEKEYALPSPAETPMNRDVPSFPGRRSIMYKIEREFEKRHAAGKTQHSLRQESLDLAAWATENITDAQIPTYKTIMNALRPKYHLHAQAKPPLKEEHAAAIAP